HVDQLATQDIERAWKEFHTLSRDTDDAELASVRRQVGHRLAALRIQSLDGQRRCEELQEPLALWRELDGGGAPDHMRAHCQSRRGLDRWNSGQLDGAADDFRRAYRLAPRDPITEQNLIGGLGKVIDGHIRGGRCLDARPLITEALALRPTDPWLQQAAKRC